MTGTTLLKNGATCLKFNNVNFNFSYNETDVICQSLRSKIKKRGNGFNSSEIENMKMASTQKCSGK
jgi:hypothetical protein